jgi:hypothetical protein
MGDMSTGGSTMHHFLLVYSYAQGRLLEQEEFLDQFEAAAAYTAVEAKYRGKLQDFEIVLVGSDSIETVMATHGHYFGEQNMLAPFAFNS